MTGFLRLRRYLPLVLLLACALGGSFPREAGAREGQGATPSFPPVAGSALSLPVPTACEAMVREALLPPGVATCHEGTGREENLGATYPLQVQPSYYRAHYGRHESSIFLVSWSREPRTTRYVVFHEAGHWLSFTWPRAKQEAYLRSRGARAWQEGAYAESPAEEWAHSYAFCRLGYRPPRVPAYPTLPCGEVEGWLRQDLLTEQEALP